jgi:hypothetical protein
MPNGQGVSYKCRINILNNSKITDSKIKIVLGRTEHIHDVQNNKIKTSIVK